MGKSEELAQRVMSVLKEVRIVPVTEQHVEGHHAVLGVVASERKYIAIEDAPPLDQVRDFIRANIADRNPMLVAVAGDRVVGWCDVVRNKRPAYAHCGTLGMGLLPEFRGMGIGRRLISGALECARAEGLVRVELTVYAHNLRAKALYEKVGFVEEGLARDGVRLDGAYHDVYHMALIDDAAKTGASRSSPIRAERRPEPDGSKPR